MNAALLKQIGFEKSNDIQTMYWEKAKDFTMLLSPTGSGKTFAFLAQAAQNDLFPLLIVSPTRELVLQLSEQAKKVFPTKMIVNCYGGHSVDSELNQLKNTPDIVVGTPGRLIDFLKRGAIEYQLFQQIIIDEYDKLLELNFREEIQLLLNASKWKKIQLSSATFLKETEQILTQYPWTIVDALDVQKPDISYYYLLHEEDEKADKLKEFLEQFAVQRIIVFCAHREACERIYDFLYSHNMYAAIYHGGLKQSERERAYIKFNRRSERVLICTDLAARGLDLPQVDIVVHYQQALDVAASVHREGRTGRNGTHGTVVYFTTEKKESIPSIENLLLKQTEIPVAVVTLYCNAGRKQKLRKVDFIGYLCQKAYIPNEAITAIDIFDNHSYITMEADWYKKVRQDISQFKLKKERLLLRVCY